MQQRERIEKALDSLVAKKLMNEAIDTVMDILEDECQSSYDDGYNIARGE